MNVLRVSVPRDFGFMLFRLRICYCSYSVGEREDRMGFGKGGCEVMGE